MTSCRHYQKLRNLHDLGKYLSKKAKCEKVDVNFSVKMKILTIQQRIKFRPDRVQWRVQRSLLSLFVT